MRLFLTVLLNGLTVASLYFIVSSGFTLIFGLMRTVNLAHGALYLLGGYVGYALASSTGSWALGAAGAAVALALVGVLVQYGLLSRMPGQDLRQALLTIGLAMVMGDQMIARFGGLPYQIEAPGAFADSVRLPIVGGINLFRLSLIPLALLVAAGLWLLLNRTKLGMMIRAGVDDRAMLEALGVNVNRVFIVVFALGAALAGFAGVVGATVLSIAPGEDSRFLLSSLAVVIVGGMGSLGGAAVGAVLIALAEQFGLAYFPAYSVVLTFAILTAVLAFKPQGLLGRPS